MGFPTIGDIVGYFTGNKNLGGSDQPLGWDLIDRITGSNSGTSGFKWLTEQFTNPLDITGANAAQKQYEYQLALNKDTQAYNSAEAQRQREWEEQMSNTAIQRQMADLKAAGLNPWLALNGGSAQGASTGSGSSAASSSGSASMANNKLLVAAGVIATALRIFLTKGK